MTRALPPRDLDHVLAHTRPLWEEVRGKRIFITGGTGFFGCWLLESFVWINRELELNASATVLTRDPSAFARKAPHLTGNPAIHLLQGDVRDFHFPHDLFPFAIHAATEASLDQAKNRPREMLSTILDGAGRILEFARTHGTRKLLFTSSGAVYGKQPPSIFHISEDYEGAPDPLDPGSVYGEGKRMAEQMCSLTPEIQCKIARCFAFVGPHLPLDTHFAIGNFIRDAIAEKPIHVRGDGLPHRSYLYASDLAIWLWTILLEAPPLRAYNVGSEDSISILDLARETASTLGPGLAVQVDHAPAEGASIPRYVPSTARARQELRLRQHIGLQEAIRRTAEWYRTPR